MLKSFTKRSLFIGLFSVFILGNINHAMATSVTTCYSTMGTDTCISSSSTTVTATAFNPTAGGLYGCTNATRHNLYYSDDSSSTSPVIGYWSTCNTCAMNYTRQYYSQLPGVISATGAAADATRGGYVCCGTKSTSSSTDILSPTGYYGYVGSRTTITYSKSYTLVDICDVDIPDTKYYCTCVAGFVSSTGGTSTSSCNCVLDTASGYTCHATNCGTGKYISDDGKSCVTCPSGDGDTITDADGNTVYGTTLGTATGANGCYLNSGTYADDTGEFNYNAACYYKE